MRRFLLAALVAAAPACAQVETSPRPETRPQMQMPTSSPTAPLVAEAPAARPEGGGIGRAISRIVPGIRQGGGLCGVSGIEGTRIAAVPGPGGCGIDRPVRVQSVAGIALERPARMDCDTARALKTWVEQGVKPMMPDLAALKVAAGYSCRPRNNQARARLSEHSRGKAIDISAFRMTSGAELTVLEGWRDARTKPLLQRAHQLACGPFGTVLGPEADRYHQDHFHFDTADYRSGSYCR